MVNQMTTLGLIFMISAWTFVTVLTVFSVYRVFRGNKIDKK